MAGTRQTGGRRERRKGRHFDTVEPVHEDPPFSAELMRSLGLRGIQCGSAGVLFDNWLSVDRARFKALVGDAVQPGRLTRLDGRFYLCHDVTERFPLEDASFDWVYSEHMIEHLVPGDAITWLREMRRLLKPGGHMRISTPDLRKYVRGYVEPDEKHPQQRFYIGRFFEPERASKWTELRSQYLPEETESPDRPAFLLNQIFYFWGHRWIYDPDELRHIAGLAGFAPETAVECEFRSGRVPEVAQLDIPHRSQTSFYLEIEPA